jgi:hypothetical protein
MVLGCASSVNFLVYTEGGELYNLAEGEKPKLMLKGAKPNNIWFADDRKTMVVDLKNTLELRTINGDFIQYLKQKQGIGSLSDIAFSPDGERIALVYDTGKVVFWWTPKAVLARVKGRF